MAEVIAAGLRTPEGPALLPDMSIVFAQQTAGRISRLADGHPEDLAYLGGAPNACAAGASGEVYACQNGGVVGAWRSPDPRPPGIQRIDAGRAAYAATRAGGQGMATPNDLAFAPDGALWITDPGQPFDPADKRADGAVIRLSTLHERVIETPKAYCNGIAFTPEGRPLWTESYNRRIRTLHSGAHASTLCALPGGHIPDGIAVADDGRIFVATCQSHGIDVIGPDGTPAGFLPLDDRAYPSNCCFRGRTLIVTDFGTDFETDPTSGRLWELPVDAQAAPAWRGSLPTPAPRHQNGGRPGQSPVA